MNDTIEKIEQMSAGHVLAHFPTSSSDPQQWTMSTDDLKSLAAELKDLREMVDAARNFNGDKWGIRRYTIKPAEGPHELEGKWFAWKDEWEGGEVGPFDSALAAFRELGKAEVKG